MEKAFIHLHLDIERSVRGISILNILVIKYILPGCCCLVTKSCLTLATPWTVAHQAPLSVRFLRQDYKSGLPFPSPGDLADPGIKPKSPALQVVSFLSEPKGKLLKFICNHKNSRNTKANLRKKDNVGSITFQTSENTAK